MNIFRCYVQNADRVNNDIKNFMRERILKVTTENTVRRTMKQIDFANQLEIYIYVNIAHHFNPKYGVEFEHFKHQKF